MTETPLIRREVTADRGIRAVTTREVLECITEMPDETFSTYEVVQAVREKFAKHSNIDFELLERSVRQSVTWLVRRGHIQITKSTVKRYTSAREPYWVTVYLRIDKGQPFDVEFFNRVFMHV